MSDKKSYSKKKSKELLEQAAERLAEILCMQIEWMKKNKEKKVYGKGKI